MTITYPLDLPAGRGPSAITLRQRKVVGRSEAPGALVEQVYEWPGERWEGELTLPPMRRADGMRWASWLISLRGPVGTFLLGDPLAAVPLGTARWSPGTPQVDGDQAASARTLTIKTGLSVASANWLCAGSHLALGSGSTRRLHIVLKDASLDGSGKATLDIWPALRSAVANNATVTLSGATGRFFLTSQPEYRADAAGLFRSTTIGFAEALR